MDEMKSLDKDTGGWGWDEDEDTKAMRLSTIEL